MNNESNPFGKPPAPKAEVSADTSYIDMAEGNPAEAGESASAQASLAEAGEKYAVDTDSTAPSAEDISAREALLEKMRGGKEGPSLEMSEEDMQSMTPENLLEITKQIHEKKKSIEKERAEAKKALNERLQDKIKDQLAKRLEDPSVTNSERNFVQDLISDEPTLGIMDTVHRHFTGGPSVVATDETYMNQLLGEETLAEVNAFYEEDNKRVDEFDSLNAKAITANSILREKNPS